MSARPCVQRTLVRGVTLALCIAVSHAAHAEDPPADAQEVAEARKQLQALHWIEGPQHVELYNKSALDIPAGYVFLAPDDTTKFEALTHQLGSGKQYFFAPKNLHWEAYFDYQDDGYVKDDQKIDSDAILNNIKKGTEAANSQRRQKGWHELQVTGWQTPPHYDPDTKQLEWAVEGKDLVTNESITNFNTRMLGRGGVMSVVLLSDPAHLDSSIAELRTAVAHFSYLPGQRYAEYRPGDKIAKYGLAALITGGAAAIAVKTGFWKVLLAGLIAGWKFIVAGAVALYTAIVRFFKRKTN